MNEEEAQQQGAAQENNIDLEMGSIPNPPTAADTNNNNSEQEQQNNSQNRAKQIYTSVAKFLGMSSGVIGAATGNDPLRLAGILAITSSLVEVTDIKDKIDAGAKITRATGLIAGITSIATQNPILGYAASAMIGIATGTEVARKGMSMAQRILNERSAQQNNEEQGIQR